MSNYRGHTLINGLVGLPFSLGLLYWYGASGLADLTVFGVIFVYATLFMSPDMDLAYSIKKWSIRGILSMPFRIHLIRHRGISHSIFLGSLIRIVWAGSFLAMLFMLAYFVFPISYYLKDNADSAAFKIFAIKYASYLKHGVGAICCADWWHILVDHETSCA